MTNRERLAAAIKMSFTPAIEIRRQVERIRARRPTLIRFMWWVREIFGRLPG